MCSDNDKGSRHIPGKEQVLVLVKSKVTQYVLHAVMIQNTS
jgi:hypothetical protein